MAPVIGLVVGTYGSSDWARRGREVAERAVQYFDRVCHSHHADSLSQARNDGVRLAADSGCDWVVFLDADDALWDGYSDAMRASIQAHPSALVHRPATRGYYPDLDQYDDEAVLIPRRNLRVANYIVIGACVNVGAFTSVGGFPEYPILEDWALWRKIVARYGECVADAPEAVYVVGVYPESRNKDQALHRKVYASIQRDIPL